MLGLVDDVTAFALDEALDMRLSVDELRGARKRGDLPAGLRYASESDVEDWATAEGDD